MKIITRLCHAFLGAVMRVIIGCMQDAWQDGGAYERYMGRWSRRLGPEFIRWLDPAPRLRWADLGCGTGALTASVLDLADPSAVVAVEPSPGFLDAARARLGDDARVELRHGSVEQLTGSTYDIAVAGLVLNFLPDAGSAVATLRDLTPGGTVAAYVWDYQGGIEMIVRFWRAASRLIGHDLGQREVSRFELCRPDALTELFEAAGLVSVETTALRTSMEFADYDDYWEPFLGGSGPAPAYLVSLPPRDRDGLREAVREEMSDVMDDEGGISLPARAWAVRGEVRGA
jgi:trans-aconitate methyltransferase